jgi:hypothetical protein
LILFRVANFEVKLRQAKSVTINKKSAFFYREEENHGKDNFAKRQIMKLIRSYPF